MTRRLPYVWAYPRRATRPAGPVLELTCPECKGDGVLVDCNEGRCEGHQNDREWTCQTCGGDGAASVVAALSYLDEQAEHRQRVGRVSTWLGADPWVGDPPGWPADWRELEVPF